MGLGFLGVDRSDVGLRAGSATEVILECKGHKFRKDGDGNPGGTAEKQQYVLYGDGAGGGSMGRGRGSAMARGNWLSCKWLTIKEVRAGMGLEAPEDSVSRSTK